MSNPYWKNRMRLFQTMARLGVFTEREIVAEMRKDGGSLAIDQWQSIGQLLMEMSDIGAIRRQNDVFIVR